ncbi:MAG: bacillithiol system redox-active protein YtxJ [Acidobacteriota bacterium]|nr:bacillithiol system redox-active protein YtxJ [Acidobacteriota bacterium]
MFSWWSKRNSERKKEMLEVGTPQNLDILLGQDLLILFKHSNACPVSWAAYSEVRRFQRARPEMPVHLVSVRQERELARYIVERTGIRHESPQIIVVRRGAVVGTGSHGEITSDFLTSLLTEQ